MQGGPFETIDVMDSNRITEIVNSYNINQVYHLAAMLSGNAEKNPYKAWELNMVGLFNILNLAKDYGIKKFSGPVQLQCLARLLQGKTRRR